MPIPNRFKAGEVASSAELNANFTYIEDLIGALSNEDEIAPEKDYKVGSAGYLTGGMQQMLLKGNNPSKVENVTNTARGFIDLSWNARPNSSSGRWMRVNQLSGSSVVEVSAYGVVMATTNRTTGELQSQLTPLLGVQNGFMDDADISHIFMAKDVPIITQYNNPNNPNNKEGWEPANRTTQDYYNSIQRRRFTFVPFDEPKTIMEKKRIDKGEQKYNLLSYGVPKKASFVELLVYATATYDSGAGLIMKPDMDKTHMKYGLICHAYGGATAGWGRSAVQGKVRVYGAPEREVKEGEFVNAPASGTVSALPMVIEATAAFSEVSIYIQGYYV